MDLPFPETSLASNLPMCAKELNAVAQNRNKKTWVQSVVQIKKRTGEFNKDDFDQLNKIDSDEKHILFGKYVLLGNDTKAKKYFEQFSEEDQSRYKGFPIYKLYDQL